MKHLGAFQCHYRPLFVILSYTISVLGAYCALQWAARISAARGRARAIWLTGAAVAMGGGAIWSMHFIAMMACRLPVPIAYDFVVTLASLLVAVVATGIGLHIVSRVGAGYRRLVAGGVFTGLAVAGMHYTGMAAMRLPARTTYQPWIVAASVVIAIVAATAAFWIAFNLGGGWQRLASSLVMGVAVCGMHYTGMAAAVFVPTGETATTSTSPALASEELAYMVFGVTLLILTLLSVGGRALAGKLYIAAKISILTGLGTLVALGGTSILLIRMQANLAADQQALRSSLQQIQTAMALDTTFKMQVQEWENVLLRGRDSVDFEKHREAFFRLEGLVQENGRTLSTVVPPAIGPMVASFLKTHEILGRHYRAALDVFIRSGRRDYQSADRMVRGEDRPPTYLIEEIVRSIGRDQKLYESSHAAQLLDEQRRTALAAAALFLGLVLIGIWIGRRITAPVLKLSRVVSRVSAERDYTLRVPRGSGGEVGLLEDGFNEMLAQIQSQNAALQGAQNELEKRVEQRTRELKKANSELGLEIAERERGHAERARLAAFTADVGGALTRSESLPRALDACAQAMVQHLGAAFASIWVVNAKEPILERRAEAGGEDLPGSLDRIPVGQFRIGRIAAEGRPRIMDLTAEPPQDDDKGWARQKGMVSFAGYPLEVGGRCLGVMAMFAREPITEPALDAMATVADAIALGIGRERGAEALRASEALTRSVIEAMLEGLIIVDTASVIRSVNPAAERMFGYEPGSLVGQSLTCLVADTGGVAAREFFHQATSRAMGRVTEWQGRRKQGDVFPMELSLFEFWTSEGRHFGGAVKDLSERREVDRLKREFVSTVSHELRTPLTSIRGALGLVVGGAAGPLPAQAKNLLEIALKNSERLALLVNDILDMEKIESGQLEFKVAEFEVAPVLEATVEGNRSYADAYGVVLSAENGAPGARVYADADRLTQAITNLLSNAVKFSPAGETVRLVASRRRGAVRLEIVDRGPGIPEEFRSRIFGRFQQADSSDTRQKGGTGLGLAITRLIVEKLGGHIGFETEIGRGSTFWIELPEVGVGRADSVGAANPGSQRPRILHVDDDPDLPRIVAAALSDFADVDVARTVREARERLHAAVYDVVVLDVGLPDGSGLELRGLLDRPNGAPTPFILFTAREIPQDGAGSAAAILVKSRATVAGLVDSVKFLILESRRLAVAAPGLV
jgi:PAS domain S-box-containing protein